MLDCLVGRVGRLVTHDELLEALWPGTFGATTGRHIQAIRPCCAG
jgi:DNA-binding winged helix-turn-helix (wHTH) protein